MDWQEWVALGIVGLTAAIFAWRQFRPRRFRLGQSGGCGCAATPSSPPPRVLVRSRRGERPQVIISPR